jgi:hypothetical protein
MRNHFTQLPDKIFKIVTVFYGLLGDLLICAYLWIKFSDISNFLKIMNNFFPMDLKAFDDQFKEQLFLLNLQSLKLIFALYLFLHCTIYICLLLNKKFAYNYLKFFVWVAAPCCLSFGIVSLFERSGFLNGLFFVQGLLYLYVALGFYYKKVGATN